MANKGFFGSIMFLASVTIALLSMCCVGSAQGVAATRDEVLTSYLGHTGLHAVQAMRSGNYSRVSFVCDTEQWDLQNDYIRTPSEYFMSFVHKPSKELRIKLTPYDCMIVTGLVSSFDSGNRVLTYPALWHEGVYRTALKHSSTEFALIAASHFFIELGNSWQTQCFAEAAAHLYASDLSLTWPLRKVLVDITVQHYTALWESRDEHKLFSFVGLAFPEFAADVSRARAESNSSRLSEDDQ
ncbi:hypothetical protein LTR56_010909 [Elasticomyces elasticus]|nr:hypothetical protein LTR56_010909 [Elasticomyces elasticus]KAK3662608.1 hypothetical protein LTR22_006458 [Elasticomyces elasticus]KAK4926608.1 hypothetical protein LTR49_006542 [Elasticomyces elasticus]KAK5760701.1 hypothetical protein LTS12_009238 [Elasticomyces elasticus]